jgi:nitrite reductase (NO-forming)
MSTVQYAPVQTSRAREAASEETASSALFALACVALGFLVVALAFVAVMMWSDANGARNAADRAAASAGAGPSMAMPMPTTAPAGAVSALESFAGAAPENADAIAAAHKAFPAALPAAPAGVADVNLVLNDVEIEVAPGVKYSAWAWSGGAPGPVIHVNQGQLVKITLTNDGAIPHSVDFHAARVAPDKAFGDVMPGKSVSYTFRANDPGVFMYHCGTKPVLAHIANGMYGAIVVSPKPGVLPHADRDYVLVASEWYLSSDGLSKPAQLNMAKAHARQPDWMTFNGYAGQYVKHPLAANPGETVRFWVMDAGPSIDTDFHIVGTILNRAWVDGALTNEPLRNVQTVGVPAGGGAVFDVKIEEPGLYPFVSHAFAAVDQGQVGLLNVGDVKGTMSH